MGASKNDLIVEKIGKILYKYSEKSDDSIPLGDLVRLTEKAFNERNRVVENLRMRMKSRLNSNFIRLDYIQTNNELEINIDNHNEILKFVDDDILRTKNSILYANLLQKIGRELEIYYNAIANNDSYIKNTFIDNDEFSISIKLDDNSLGNNVIRIRIGNSDMNCSIEKYCGESYSINTDSYSLTLLLEYNLRKILDNVCILKSKCPDLIVKMYENEIMEQKKSKKGLIKTLFNKKSQD